MKRKLFFSFLFIAVVSASVFAQSEGDPAMLQKIRDEGMNHSQVMQTAFYLSDVSGPRLAGSPGLKRAQDWAVEQLKSWGLANAQREPWGKFGKGWEVQKNYAAITAPYYHAIIAIPKAWTPGTNGAIKSDVVLLKIDTTTDFDKYKGKLAGKIVIFDTKTVLALKKWKMRLNSRRGSGARPTLRPLNSRVCGHYERLSMHFCNRRT
jgi:carboxypeptidase Q